ncbi:hypothetical protein VTK56DRAFT_3096 [Thermocarpiscus australiensis]
MKILDDSSKTDIEVQAKVAFSGLGDGVEAAGKVESAKSRLNKSTDITIKAFWNGGGQVKESEAAWSVDELIAVAGRFPNLCAKTPSKSYAILKKYIHLASFQSQAKQITPLSYENAAMHTDILLEDFLRYRRLYKQLTNIIEGIQRKTVEFDPNAPAPEAEPPFKPTLAGKDGLLDAKGDLLTQTSGINIVVDEITADPNIVNTFSPDKPPRYMDPIRWKLRLPATRRTIVPPTPVVLDPKIILRGKPAVTTLPGGKHEAFAQGSDGFLWHKLTTPGTTDQNAEVWEFHGDSIPLNGSCSPVCAAGGAPENPRKYCCVVGANSKLYFKSMDGPQGKWSALQPLDVAKDVRFDGGIAACSRGDRIDLVAVGVDGAVYWTSSTGGKGAWASLARLSGPSIRGVPTLVVNGADGSLNLIAIDHDSHLQANILPANSSGWSGWKASPGSWVQGNEISATWPAHPDPNWNSQIDIMVLGDNRNRIWQTQLLRGAWRDFSDDFRKDLCRGPVAVVSVGPQHEEFFVVAEQGALWQTTYNQAKGLDPHTGWKSIDRGPFRPLMPVVVPLGGDELAVYVVNSADGKLVRLVSSGGNFAGAERV